MADIDSRQAERLAFADAIAAGFDAAVYWLMIAARYAG